MSLFHLGVQVLCPQVRIVCLLLSPREHSPDDCGRNGLPVSCFNTFKQLTLWPQLIHLGHTSYYYLSYYIFFNIKKNNILLPQWPPIWTMQWEVGIKHFHNDLVSLKVFWYPLSSQLLFVFNYTFLFEPF